MNATSFITFLTYMIRQNVKCFWKGLFAAFKLAPDTMHSSRYSHLYEGRSYIHVLIATHVLVHVRI